jgi:hypothetical protein
MTKYTQYDRPGPRRSLWNVHPIWRGIGCFFVILLPLMSFAGAYMLVRENFKQAWIALPPEMLKSTILPILGRVYTADLVATLLLMLVGFGVLSLVYAFLYGMVGPSRYGPLDSPPIKRRKKRR